MMRTCLSAGVFVSVLAAAALAADPVPDLQSMKWQPAPPMLPKGAEFAVLAGDPMKDGVYVVRMRLPNGYKVPAHSHPTPEYVTVLSGDFHIGMGDKLDPAKSVALRPGGFAEAPAKMNHYGWTEGGAVIEVSGPGPFEITYVDPADDPRNKTQ